MHNLFVSILLLLLFFVSGVQKIFSFGSSVSGFMKQTSLSLQVSQLAILLAIAIEVLVPLIVWYESYKHNSVYSKTALACLILFTIIATAIYHGHDMSGILKNGSIIGGMLLLRHVF